MPRVTLVPTVTVALKEKGGHKAIIRAEDFNPAIHDPWVERTDTPEPKEQPFAPSYVPEDVELPPPPAPARLGKKKAAKKRR